MECNVKINTHSRHPASTSPHQCSRAGLKFIPRDIIHKTAKETGVDVKARTYSVLSHLGTMLFAQLAHALSLNDVCDSLRLKARAIAALGLTPPSRNNLSNSNKVRDAKFAELVFWRTLAHLQHCDASFGRQRPGGTAGRSLLHRFKVRIHAVDSTVMELVANCMDWAKHRRRKAAAKMHLRLGLNGFLPTFAKQLKGWTLRRVEAWVEVDGELRLMVFITNNTAWSARSVCDLYRARWDIEVLLLRCAHPYGAACGWLSCATRRASS